MQLLQEFRDWQVCELLLGGLFRCAQFLNRIPASAVNVLRLRPCCVRADANDEPNDAGCRNDFWTSRESTEIGARRREATSRPLRGLHRI